jgi:tetratricopeptide (TPR) repeat protein
MAEGMLGEVLGGEAERQDVETPDSRAGAEAFAAAIAAIASRQDPEVARKTAEFLDHQSRLLETQRQHLKDEHALRLANLRHQAHLLRGQRISQFFRIAFQTCTALAVAAIGVAIVAAVRDAMHARSVIVEPFESPSSLTARGLTGKVVAGGLLDELRRLQFATRADIEKRDLSSAWAGDVRLEVPETGISFSDVSRLLKGWLGHELHISGDVTELPTGELAVAVRGDGLVPQTFNALPGQIDRALSAAAGYIYSEAQPSLWAAYLVDSGRYEDAVEFCRGKVTAASALDRVSLYQYWATALLRLGGSGEQAVALYREALALDPARSESVDWLAGGQLRVGDEEGAWRSGQHLRANTRGRIREAPDMGLLNYYALVNDYATLLKVQQLDAEHGGGEGTSTMVVGPQIAWTLALLHDSAAAELALQTTKVDPRDSSIVPLTHFVRGLVAMDRNDNVRAANEFEGAWSAFADPAVAYATPGAYCWVALAEELAGRPDKADGALAVGGKYVDCYRFHGDILDRRGDWTGAQRAYAASVSLAPDLPSGYYSWGMALAAHGDLKGATAKFKDANERGPLWADPLKAWGDVLVKQGHPKDALRKYDEALKYAPNWKELKEAHEAVTQRSS